MEVKPISPHKARIYRKMIDMVKAGRRHEIWDDPIIINELGLLKYLIPGINPNYERPLPNELRRLRFKLEQAQGRLEQARYTKDYWEQELQRTLEGDVYHETVLANIQQIKDNLITLNRKSRQAQAAYDHAFKTWLQKLEVIEDRECIAWLERELRGLPQWESKKHPIKITSPDGNIRFVDSITEIRQKRRTSPDHVFKCVLKKHRKGQFEKEHVLYVYPTMTVASDGTAVFIHHAPSDDCGVFLPGWGSDRVKIENPIVSASRVKQLAEHLLQRYGKEICRLEGNFAPLVKALRNAKKSRSAYPTLRFKEGTFCIDVPELSINLPFEGYWEGGFEIKLDPKSLIAVLTKLNKKSPVKLIMRQEGKLLMLEIAQKPYTVFMGWNNTVS